MGAQGQGRGSSADARAPIDPSATPAAPPAAPPAGGSGDAYSGPAPLVTTPVVTATGSVALTDPATGSVALVDPVTGGVAVVDATTGSLALVDPGAGTVSVVDPVSRTLAVVDQATGALTVIATNGHTTNGHGTNGGVVTAVAAPPADRPPRWDRTPVAGGSPGGNGSGRSRSSNLLLVVALYGLFSTNFNVSVLAVTVPILVKDFNAPPSTVSWLVVGPTLAYAVLGPTAGKLGDLYGRRRVYLIGLVGCAVFAGLTAGAPTALTAILFRTASAVFGQSTAPTGMAIISEAYPPERRVTALGYWGLVMAGGPVLGMVLGGPLIDAVGWRWIFIVQIPLILVALVLAIRILPVSTRLRGVRFDIPGTVLLAGTAFSVLFAINRGPLWGWSHPVVLTLLVASPFTLAGFVAWERQVEHPLLPLAYFRTRRFVIPMAVQAVAQISYQGGFVLIPILLAGLYGYSTTHISLLTIGRPLMWGLAGPTSALLVSRFASRRIVVVGVLLNSAGCLALTRIGLGTSQAEIVALLGFAGVGVGMIVAPLMAMLTRAVSATELGVATATSQMMVQIGSAAGVQLMQTIQVSRLKSDGLAGSYHAAFIVAGLLSSLALVGALAVPRREGLSTG